MNNNSKYNLTKAEGLYRGLYLFVLDVNPVPWLVQATFKSCLFLSWAQLAPSHFAPVLNLAQSQLSSSLFMLGPVWFMYFQFMIVISSTQTVCVGLLQRASSKGCVYFRSFIHITSKTIPICYTDLKIVLKDCFVMFHVQDELKFSAGLKAVSHAEAAPKRYNFTKSVCVYVARV